MQTKPRQAVNVFLISILAGTCLAACGGGGADAAIAMVDSAPATGSPGAAVLPDPVAVGTPAAGEAATDGIAPTVVEQLADSDISNSNMTTALVDLPSLSFASSLAIAAPSTLEAPPAPVTEAEASTRPVEAAPAPSPEPTAPVVVNPVTTTPAPAEGVGVTALTAPEAASSLSITADSVTAANNTNSNVVLADAGSLQQALTQAVVAAPQPDAVTTAVSAPVSSSSAARLLQASAGIVVTGSAVAGEDWAGAINKVKTVPSWAGWVAGRKTLNDTWAAKQRERADLVGGWMSHYVDANGLPQTWTPDTPEPPDGSTTQQINFKRAWVFYMRGYNISRVGDAARIYKVTGDTKYRDWAAAQLDFYATNYLLWPLRTINGRGRMFQTGLDEATASFVLLDAARLLTPAVSATRSQTWKAQLFMPMADNLKVISSPNSNISLWQAAAVAAIGMRYGDNALVDWGLNSSGGVRATLAASLTTDNLWNEGSFSYNSYVIAALHSLVLNAAVEGQAATVQAERDKILRLLLAPLDYRFDDGMLPTPSDASPQQAMDVNLHLQVYRTAPTAWGVNKAATYQSWDTLVAPPVALSQAVPAAPTPVTANFPANRMAVLRAGSWQAFVHYGQNNSNHAQQEAPSYELYAGSTPLSTDSGTVSYGSPLHATYFTKAPANNMALVDGKGQAQWAPGAVNSFDGVNHRISVTQPTYLPNASVNRSFQAFTGSFIDRTVLTTSDNLNHRLGVVFHTGCSITPLRGLAPMPAPLPTLPLNPNTSHWYGLNIQTSATGSWAVQLTCGSQRFSYSVVGPAGQTVFIARGPTAPVPNTRPLLYYEVNGQQANFEATVSAL